MPRTARILAGFFLAVVLGLGAAAQPSGLAARPELRAVQDALARWDRKAAAHHLETLRPAVETSADLAAQVTLLEIALAPEPERLRRYLAFAAAFAEREEGLTALIAALALAEARIEKAADAEAVIAEDEEVFVFEDEEPVAEPTRVEHPIPGAPELDALLRAAAPLVDAWRARRPDDVRVRLAQRLLLRNRAGARADREPLLRVPTGTPIPVPSPLAEPLRVLVHRLPHPGADVRPYLEGTASDPPVLERVLPAGEIVADLPALPAGAYVLEARSEKSAWRDLRRIVVSDLQLAAQVFPDGVAVLVALKRRPAGGVALAVTDTAGGFEPARGVTDSSGFVLLPLSLREGKRANGNGSALEIAASIEDASGIHTTSLSANVPAAAGADDLLPELDAHVLTDRPLYRAGETIEGRLVVRVHRPAPMPGLLPAAGVKPVTEPLAGRELRLEVELPKAKPAVLDLVTDAWGVAPFSIRLAPTAAPGEIRLSAWMPLEPGERFAGMDARSDAPKVRVLGVTQPAQIQDYKRPPLLLEVAWPEVKSRNENPVIVVTARHPAGTPAAGLAGTATVSAGARWSERPLRHEEPFVLDAGGRAEIRLGLSRLEVPADCSFWVDAEVTVTAADGQRVRRGPGIMYRHETSPSAPPAAEPSATIDVTGPGGRAKAGEPVTVKVQGPAGAPVLLSVARETLLHCRSVVLDARGRAEVSLPTERDWWPSVFVAATGFDAAESGRWWEPGPTRIDLEEPAAKLTVALEKDRETYLPGARASWKLTTRDGDGRPVPATVSMAVVDETLFALARDRTRDPWDVLRSRDGSLRLNESRSPSFAAIWDALGQLLRGGVIPAPSWSELLGFDWRGGGAYGGRRYGGYGEGRDPIAATRKDFRATAFFAPAIVTGDDGKAEVSFSFPDDLTTWRVTMCAVGKGREAALVRETARTEKPLAVELELPRLFRSGDELAVPASVHQTGGAPQEVALELEAGGALELPAGDRRIELSTAPDAARGREVTLTAVGEGEAILRAVLTSAGPDGEVHDRLERKLSVLTRNAHRIERDSALVSGRAILEPPRLEGIPRHGPLTVEVLGSVEALLDKASAYLAAYPHGCVEQIASGLAPLLLAIETHRALGGEGHGLTPPQAHRLEVGLARLRDLQQPDGGFAWWPGLSDSDPTMSAIVFGFLARMREVGLDPADYGLRTEADLEIFGQAERALTPAPDRTKEDPATGPFPTGARAFLLQPLARDTRREQALALAAAELMTARLLLRPKDEAAARICAQLGAGGDRLPTGLAARLGRALARSGNLEAAGSLLTTLRARLESTGSFGADLSIAESPACRAAALLELVLEIAPKDVLRDRLVRDLMRRSRDGRLDHTAGTAAAVWALARERKAAGAVVPPAEAFTLALMGEAAGQPIRRELRCDPAEGWSWSLELPSELERVAVDGPTGRRLLVTARVAYAGDGATAGALDRPIRLDRRLYRLAAKADGSFQRERLDAEVARGDLLEVELAIEAPPDLDHLVLECPVPAGFEAIAQQGLVVHDDRVALTVPRLFEGGRESRTFRMIPGRAGRVVWPPAEIEAMYAPEKSGRSSGAALTVGAPRAIAADAGRAELLTAAHLDGLRKAWRDGLDPALDPEKLESRLATLALCPDRPIREWLFEAGPGRLGDRLGDRRVCPAYLKALGSRLWDRLDAARLPELLEIVDPNRATAVDIVARALVNADQGDDVARRFVAGQWRSPLEARLLGLTALYHGSLPGDPWEKLDRAAMLVEAGDQEPGDARAEVAGERWARLIAPSNGDAQGRVRNAWGGLVTEPLREAARSIWQEGQLSIGNRETPERVEKLDGHVERFVARQLDRDREGLCRLAEALEPLLADAGWGTRGSAEPAGHQAYRRRLAAALGTLAARIGPELVPLARSDAHTEELWQLLTTRALTSSQERAALASSVLSAALDSLTTHKDHRGLLDLTRLVLDSFPAPSPETTALEPLAWRVLAAGPMPLRASAFRMLSEANRQAIPTAALCLWLRETPGAVWLVEELIGSGPDAQAATIRCPGVLVHREVSRILAAKCDLGVLKALSLDELAALIGHRDADEDSEVCERLLEALAAGPWPDAAIAERLARPSDVRVRSALLEVCGARGVVPETWSADDPAAERYRILLAARNGDPEAAATVRSWLWAPDDPAASRRVLVWALGRAAQVKDIFRLESGPAADRLRREVLARAPAEEIAAVWNPARNDPWSRNDSWSRADVTALLEKLPPEVAAGLVPPALAAWIENDAETLAVFRRAPALSVLSALLPAVDSLGPRKALNLLDALKDRPEAVLPIALRLVAHPGAAVREHAASLAHRISGELVRFRDAAGNERRAGPTGPADYLRALATRIGRHGPKAVAAALDSPDPADRVAAQEWLSREGLHLGP